MNPFQVFDIAPSFDLNLSELEGRHRELSKVLHPDRYVGAPSGERRQALGKAIEVNEAWRKLKDPIQRAEALCAVLGIERSESTEPKADPMLLMEMMEQREALGDARRSKNLDEVEKLASAITVRQREVLTELTRQFAALSPPESDASSASGAAGAAGGEVQSKVSETDREQLLRELGKLRYFRRFLDEANAILDELE
ncbi:MAG: Fe-S protein assembly co-chaperone HscB [Myxococcales bacterium]|nr:Fe-S protein assembly co-chaperone HscB [Myxococcales bacterium]